MAVFRGAVGWAAERAAFVGTILTSPMNDSDNRDWHEIIRDPRTSLAEKQKAIGNWWRSYERHGANWGDEQKRAIVWYSAVVYAEAKKSAQPQR